MTIYIAEIISLVASGLILVGTLLYPFWLAHLLFRQKKDDE